ncbi:MAG: 3-deoxy-7-phosphoheptulonate synthase class II [Pseudomonadota bacterium]
MKPWTKESWRGYAISQAPSYPDEAALEAVTDRLEAMPPLIFAGEARSMRKKLAQVVEGKAFLLQGGDCAESFESFSADGIRDTFRVLLQMAVVLTYAGGVPVVKAGRMAGQFAKPRSAPEETKGDASLPVYRGDIVNGYDFDEAARVPDPQRMMTAYAQSAATLNLLRAFAQGGLADLHRVHEWTLAFLSDSPQGDRYRAMADDISRAVDFMTACGIRGATTAAIRETEFFTCHEALLLPFEQAMTRIDSLTGRWYDTSAHFLWIGERTRDLNGAHVNFLRGVENPIGLKCGPTMTPDDLLELIDLLNPGNEPGRLTLMTRMGAQDIERALPALVQAVQKQERQVVWCCDPMHGNTVRSALGMKTRRFDDIHREVRAFFKIVADQGAFPGGLHLEMTGQDVTECTGGAQQITDDNLALRYKTACDPRLNASQALELVFEVANFLERSGENPMAKSA